MADGTQSAVRTVVVGAVILGIGVVLISTFVGAVADQTAPEDIAEDVLIAGGDGDVSHEGPVENLTVNQSLGTAVEFTGASDSGLQGQADIDHDETWSASLWARSDQVRDQRALQLDDWLYVDLVNNSGTAAWRVTYYDEFNRQTEQLQVSASNSTTTWTNLVVTSNGSTLTLFENNSQVASTPINGGDSIPNGTNNWDGRLEETRVLDDEVNSSQRSTLYSEPTAPVKANETARIYFDLRPSEGSVDIYRTGTDLDLSNASRVDGFQGQGAVEGPDYEFSRLTLTALDGGTLDGAPVAFVDYDGVAAAFGGFITQFRSILNGALPLAAVVLVVVIATQVIKIVRQI